MKISLPELFSKIASPGFEPAKGSSPKEKDLFAKVLAEVNGLQRQADTKIQEFLLGRTDLHEAMLSLERASLGLKVLVQARNKIIQAYEELSRMTV